MSDNLTAFEKEFGKQPKRGRKPGSLVDWPTVTWEQNKRGWNAALRAVLDATSPEAIVVTHGSTTDAIYPAMISAHFHLHTLLRDMEQPT